MIKNITIIVLVATSAAVVVAATSYQRGANVPSAANGLRTPAKYNRADEVRSKAFNAAWLEGQKAKEQGDWTTAERGFLEASRLEPRVSGAYAELAKAYIAQGRKVEAREAYEEAFRKLPGRQSSLTSGARELVRYGDLCLATGLKGDAVRAYRAAVAGDYDPGASTSTPKGETLASLQVAAHGQAAVRCRIHGDYKEAESFLRQAAQVDPKDWRTRYALGSILAAEGHRDQAASEMRKAEQ